VRNTFGDEREGKEDEKNRAPVKKMKGAYPLKVFRALERLTSEEMDDDQRSHTSEQKERRQRSDDKK